ncbi:MAG: DNA polymerase III subunit gamma/tau, partial [Candidatus Puniceispirillaceae bacterium]
SMQAAGGSDDALIESEREIIAGLAESGIARLGRAWQLLLKGHGELGQAPNPAAACEMLIIRLAHTAHMPTPGELMQKLPKTSPSSPPSASLATATPAPSTPVASASVTSSVETAPIETAEIATAPIETGAGMPSSLAEIVALAETNGEMLLAARIRNHVKLVSLKPGNLQIGLVGAAPDQLAGDIARYLSQWTGQRWLVSLSESGGAQTIAEEQRGADEKLRDTIANEPLVAQILDIFPGASIDEIKNPEATDAAGTLVDDNGLLEAGQNNDDDEEMSG